MIYLILLNTFESITKLFFADDFRIACLTLLKQLSDAENNIEVMSKRTFYFVIDNGICLAENMPALTVCKNNGLHAEINKDFCRNFTGKGTIFSSRHILRAKQNIRIFYNLADCIKIYKRRSNHEFTGLSFKLCNKLFCKRNSTLLIHVHFPISRDLP